jgi:alpha-galactosidase
VAGARAPPPVGQRGATPILGWNNCQINCGAGPLAEDALVRATARALNESGLAAAGYVHLNLDDAWMSAARGPGPNGTAGGGALRPDVSRFPDFGATAAYVRSLGLQLGLYTAAGDRTCSGRPGSCDHEAADAAQFVAWGLAHVKDDACSTCRDAAKKGAPADYAAMAAALKAAAAAAGVVPPLLMVEGTPPFPLAADGRHGDVRRVGHDINADWLSILSLVDLGSGLWKWARPGTAGSSDGSSPGMAGFFNDLEMMELGNGDFVAEGGPAALARAQAHMTMWATMKSPLVLSTDLGALGAATRAVATNALALRVSQDPLGAQVRRVRSDEPPPLAAAGAVAAAVPAVRRSTRDVVAVAALCDGTRATQRWRWHSAAAAGAPPSALPLNGTLVTTDADGFSWCLTMAYSGIWSVVPYTPGSGNATQPPALCTDAHGAVSRWRAQRAGAGGGGLGESWAFVWQHADGSDARPYGFGWGQDEGSSGPLPHTRWLHSNAGGNWSGDLAAAAAPGSRGEPFSPAALGVIDDDGVGGVGVRPGAAFCLDVVRGGNVETWAGPLQGGAVVAVVLNRAPAAQNVVVNFAEVGLNVSAAASRVRVRSAWGEAGVLGGNNSSYVCDVPAHGAALLVLELEPGDGS